MQNHAAIDAVTASTVQPTSAATPSGDFRDKDRQETPDVARYRLVIEEGPSAGTFIYKTMDRVTGEVVRQLPRERVIDMMRDPTAYSAGSVIDTKA